MSTPAHLLAVMALITNQQDFVLLIRSPDRGWEPPGGHVEAGETLIQALEREVLEESGVQIAVGDLVGLYTNMTPPPRLILAFLGQWLTGEPKTSDESLESVWVPRSEVLGKISNPANQERVKDMLDFSGKIVYRVYVSDPYKVLEEIFLGGSSTGSAPSRTGGVRTPK